MNLISNLLDQLRNNDDWSIDKSDFYLTPRRSTSQRSIYWIQKIIMLFSPQLSKATLLDWIVYIYRQNIPLSCRGNEAEKPWEVCSCLTCRTQQTVWRIPLGHLWVWLWKEWPTYWAEKMINMESEVNKCSFIVVYMPGDVIFMINTNKIVTYLDV